MTLRRLTGLMSWSVGRPICSYSMGMTVLSPAFNAFCMLSLWMLSASWVLALESASAEFMAPFIRMW